MFHSVHVSVNRYKCGIVIPCGYLVVLETNDEKERRLYQENLITSKRVGPKTYADLPFNLRLLRNSSAMIAKSDPPDITFDYTFSEYRGLTKINIGIHKFGKGCRTEIECIMDNAEPNEEVFTIYSTDNPNPMLAKLVNEFKEQAKMFEASSDDTTFTFNSTTPDHKFYINIRMQNFGTLTERRVNDMVENNLYNHLLMANPIL